MTSTSIAAAAAAAATTAANISNYGSTHSNIPIIHNPMLSSVEINEDDGDNDDDDDADDNTPLIHRVQTNLSIPIPSHRREGFPAYSPPSYSTFPRLPSLMDRNNSSREEFERNRRAGLV